MSRGRTARLVATVAAGSALVLALACGPEDRAGPRPAPGEPLPGLAESQTARFLLGKAVFERLATEEEGLGPLYNATRCSDCHDQPTTGGTGDIRVVKATRWEGGRCDLLRDEGGDNIQQAATPRLLGLGLGPETIPARANRRASVRPTSLYGLGLMEAIPLETLEALADPDDSDGDGVSGRLGRSEEGRPGRFGRKAEVTTIRDFVDSALRFELGFSTPEHPVEERLNGRDLPPGADPMPEPEIDARGVDLLTEYIRYLAPPPRQVLPTGPRADSVAGGESLFEDVGCTDCHVPALETGRHRVAALSRQDVELYSDLLLHDLGAELAGVCGPGATPTEHRTAPLWGLRDQQSFLHDGRADSLSDAIALHGGEAAHSLAAFQALSAGDQRLLLLFLASL